MCFFALIFNYFNEISKMKKDYIRNQKLKVFMTLEKEIYKNFTF